MAAADAPRLKPADDGAGNKKLRDEFDQRLTDARRQKTDVELDLREGYFFTKPRLSRSVRSDSTPEKRPDDAEELATGIGTEANEDFATELINGFFPPNVPWAVPKAGETVEDDVWDQVKDDAVKLNDAVFRGIRSSNFDAELATALVPEGGIGTVALLIEDRVAHEPIRVQHIPFRELEINIGPMGTVDDRFIVRHTQARNVPALFPRSELPAKVAAKIAKKPTEIVECRWGWWRDWSEPNDIVWRAVSMVMGEVVTDDFIRGHGSCPLVVFRFAPDSLHAWGNGPTLDSLPMLRIVDILAEATQNRADISIAPPLAYPDDGIMNFEAGLRSGMAYPKRPGARGEIEPLYFTGDPDLGFYTLADLEKSIRRKHFADYPEQRGDTPPTATQWLDEMVKSQRRVGTWGQKFWDEGPAEIYRRFYYLLEKRGSVEALTIEGRDVALRPSNPATKAQELQEVQTGMHLLEVAKSFFPQTSQVAIDEMKTIKNFKDKLGDRLVVLRSEDEQKGIMQALMNAGENMLGSAAQAEGGAPPA